MLFADDGSADDFRIVLGAVGVLIALVLTWVARRLDKADKKIAEAEERFNACQKGITELTSKEAACQERVKMLEERLNSKKDREGA